ncbi:Conserved oligomeric Golgi complex subunit 5 [Halotydeus destructor]|nr:Conserved oligomeric Golgi complex subunit 5 [Halotydeus destructor]
MSEAQSPVSVQTVIDQFHGDSILTNFVSDPSELSEDAVHAIDQIPKVKAALDFLTKQIYSLVSEKFTSMVELSEKTEILHSNLLTVQQRISSLTDALEKLKNKLSNPYNKISPRIVLLNRLKVTTDLLRKIIRIIQLVKRLQQAKLDEADVKSLNSRDVAKFCLIISEIETVIQSDDRLLKVCILEKDITYALEMKAKLAS